MNLPLYLFLTLLLFAAGASCAGWLLYWLSSKAGWMK